MLHLWPKPTKKSNATDYMKTMRHHPREPREPSRPLNSEQKTQLDESEIDVVRDGGMSKSLTVIAIARDFRIRRPVNLANFEYYVRSLIGYCNQCFVCTNPVELKNLDRPLAFSTKLLEMELNLSRDVDQ